MFEDDLGSGSFNPVRTCLITISLHGSHVLPGDKTSPVAMLESYIHLLKQYNAVAPCDNTLRSFMVQDFHREDFMLKLDLSSHLRHW